MIECEGSRWPVHVTRSLLTATFGLCSMCGQEVQAFGRAAKAVTHQRDDILARVARGDFG